MYISFVAILPADVLNPLVFVRHVRMRDERTQTTSLKDVCILVPRATRLNLEPTNKGRALGTRMGRLRGGYFVANL